MINPGGIPQIPGDMEVLAQHARELSRVGPEFAATGERVHAIWQHLAGVHEAPEVGQLLAATGPVQVVAVSVGEDIAAVGRALSTYAVTVKQIQERLDALRVQARNLMAEAQADKASESTLEKIGEFTGIGGDDDEYAERSNVLTGEVSAQVAAFYEAQRVCASAINALYGGVDYRADDGDGRTEKGEYGYTADQLNAAAGEDGVVPWGESEEKDRGLLGDVVSFAFDLWLRGMKGVWVDGVGGMSEGVASLFGRDPATGGMSLSTAATAWKDLGTFVVALGVYSAPAGGDFLDHVYGIPGFARGELGDTLTAAGREFSAYDMWGKDPIRAAGGAAFNVVSVVFGTKGAGGTLRGVGAAAEGSRAAAVSTTGTAMVRAGEAIGRLPKVSEIVKGIAQRFPSLRLPDFSAPHVNIPHHTDAPPIRIRAAESDIGPRPADLHASPIPGSVGDYLAQTSHTHSSPQTVVVWGDRSSDGQGPALPSSDHYPLGDHAGLPVDHNNGNTISGQGAGPDSAGDHGHTGHGGTGAATSPVDPGSIDYFEARRQAAFDAGILDQDGRVPISEELDSGERIRGWPHDDTGYRVQQEDLDFLGLDQDQVDAWRRYEAPLGMPREQYVQFTDGLTKALSSDGIDLRHVDIRLQGSSAQFFSGSHKHFPATQELAHQPHAQARLDEWMGDRPETERPARIPFDAKNRLGILDKEGKVEDLSDYDVQISSDAMVDKAHEAWQSLDYHEQGKFIHPKYGFVQKRFVEEAFPALGAWAQHWETVLGREVSPALFRSAGPPDTTSIGKGISSHFRDTDWIIQRMGD